VKPTKFDWSHEIILLGGVTTTVKVAHVRLCHSRMLFVRAYPRETQEMVFDAHDRAFAFFKGTCTRGIYDNMKTAVDAVFVGKDRQYNRRFLQMCSHYLVEPVACTPASDWEKGQVENQVGLVRRRFFTPRLRFRNYEELNAWLLDQCIAFANIKFPERIAVCLDQFPNPEEFRPKGLIVRQIRQRWGSMSPAGRLLLNRRLVQAPVDAIDYVITHELCHLAEPHHGAAFFDLLEKVMPDWEQRKQKLERAMA